MNWTVLIRVFLSVGLPVMTACAGAQVLRRTSESLRGEASTFSRVRAPVTEFLHAGITGTSVEINRPISEWWLKGVPSTRLVTARELMTRLQARQERDDRFVVDLPAAVLFDFDRAVLRADASKTVAQVRSLIESFPTATIAVHGHTDGLGTESYNLALGLQRAQAIASAIGGTNLKNRLVVNSYGSAQPIFNERNVDGSDNADARQRNRRVSIVINTSS